MDKHSSKFPKNPYQGVTPTDRKVAPEKSKDKVNKLDNSAPRVSHSYDTIRAKPESRGMGKTGFGGSV